MTASPTVACRHVLGMRVDATSYEHASRAVAEWAARRESRYVCVATVNNVMESFDDHNFRQVMNRADMVTPDGMPLVVALRLLGISDAQRVYGPDLTPAVLRMAEQEGIPVGFYGSTTAVLNRLTDVVRRRFPLLDIAYGFAPPFRPLTPDEDRQVIEDINASGARVLFVGLNTPKQDYWMAAHRGRIHAVMLGVGAAFDFIAGTKKQAPRWMQHCSLEWLFRLSREPRRLWKRYLKHNPRFLVLMLAQLLGVMETPLREGRS